MVLHKQEKGKNTQRKECVNVERRPGPLRCCLNSMKRQISLMKETRVYVARLLEKNTSTLFMYALTDEDFLDDQTHVNVGLAVPRP